MFKKGILIVLLVFLMVFTAFSQEKSLLSMEQALEAAKSVVLAPEAVFADEYSTYYISYFSDSQTWEIVFFAKPKNDSLVFHQNKIIVLDKDGNLLDQRNI